MAKTENDLFDLLLAATAARRASCGLVPLGPDQSVETYFDVRGDFKAGRASAPGVFHLGITDADGLREQLKRLWAGTDLESCIESVVEVAKVRRTQAVAARSAEVSELVYAMY